MYDGRNTSAIAANPVNTPQVHLCNVYIRRIVTCEIQVMKLISIAVLILLLLAGCNKDKDQLASGTVMQPGGCFSDSWIIAIDNPDPGNHNFLRTPAFPGGTFYHCGNAVFLRLSPAFAVAGTKIRFKAGEIEVTCLSYSEAPNHVKLVKIFKL